MSKKVHVSRPRSKFPNLAFARLQLFLEERDTAGRVTAFHDLGQIAVHEAQAAQVFQRKWLAGVLADWAKARKAQKESA